MLYCLLCFIFLRYERPRVLSGIPRRRGVFMQQRKPPQFPILIRHRVMQRVCPDIAPEPIQSHLQRRRARPRHFEHSRCHPQSRVGGDYFDAGDPLGDFASLLCR